MMSRRSTVMFHQVSSFLEGKVSDIKANFDNMRNLERNVYELLAEKTNKDANWWKENFWSIRDNILQTEFRNSARRDVMQ